MPITKPFNVFTTIVTTIDPANPEHMDHVVSVQTDPDVEIPEHLVFSVSQAACEHTIEHLMDKGIGVVGEIVEEAPVTGRCSVGNLLRYHSGVPCEATCNYEGFDNEDADKFDVIDVEWEDLVA